MVICTVPSSWSAESQDISKETQIQPNFGDIPTVNAASKVKAKVTKRKVTRKKVTKAKRTVKKVKATSRYKVKVRYFYKGKWRTKWVYKYYAPVVRAAPAPAPAPVIRDVPYWECYGPTANAQSDDPAIISKSRELTTKPNPDPRPEEPALVEEPGDEPQQSNYTDNETYTTDHMAWEGRNATYQRYLAAKAAYDNYNETVPLSDYDNAVNIFEYVQHATSYQYYYNTRNGAVDTLNSRAGNCCDHAHLIVALARAAGIPARYMHGDCTFSSGFRGGHVWAELWINDRWYAADAISFSNSLGTIANWNTGTWTLKGIYSSLPF